VGTSSPTSLGRDLRNQGKVDESYNSQAGRELAQLVKERLHIDVIIGPEGPVDCLPFRHPCHQSIEQHFAGRLVEILEKAGKEKAGYGESRTDGSDPKANPTLKGQTLKGQTGLHP
jgi:hypothetical protein